jgi:hypothetical protein
MNIKINIKPETIEKHIKDFPAEPKWFKLYMNAEGVSRPTDLEKGGDKKRYIDECTKHNIIPYSKIELQYYPAIKMFAPSPTKYIVTDFNELPENAKKSISESIMQGGRIHSLMISADNELREAESKEAFQLLKDSLDRMLKSSYRLDYLDICLTKGYCNQHYEEGWRSTGSLNYDGTVNVLELDAELESGIEKKLKEWLRMLEKTK